MRSSRAALTAAKLLILLALGALPQISASEAGTRCPSGQILRVSLGVCVPKAQNLAILAKHGTPKRKATETDEDAGPASSAPRPAASEAAKAERREEPVEVAQREAPRQAEPSGPGPAAPAESPMSPFGALFVGAFRSSISAGMSAFR
jgi:hypothetical protein